MTKHFVDDSGNYIGGFDGAEPPEGSTEVTPPAHGRDTWANGAWVPHTPPPQDLLAQTEGVGSIAGKLEEVIDNIENGTPISQDTRDWVLNRKTIRSGNA